jgi:phosphoribosylglycinamide formyltransferase-1
MRAVQRAIDAGEVDWKVAAVVSNNSNAPVMEFARGRHLPAFHLSRGTHPDEDELDIAICSALMNQRAEYVLLSGYLRPMGERVLFEFEDRILNIHPSLLPRHDGPGMFGDAVHQAVLDSGDTVSGVSVIS